MSKDFKDELLQIIENDKQKDNLGHVDVHKARELIMDTGAFLLDVRPPAKVEGENAQEAGIKNALYTPYIEFANYLEDIPQDKTAPLVIACVKGWFANRVAGYLEMMGYKNCYILDTSIVNLIEVHHAHSN